MAFDPKTLRFSRDHSWAHVKGEIATIGISDFAQKKLKNIVFIDMPAIGRNVEKGKPAATIESVKSVSDVFSPLSGKVVEVNEKMKHAPEIVNTDPYGEGWLFKIKVENASEIKSLLSLEEYTKISG